MCERFCVCVCAFLCVCIHDGTCMCVYICTYTPPSLDFLAECTHKHSQIHTTNTHSQLACFINDICFLNVYEYTNVTYEKIYM